MDDTRRAVLDRLAAVDQAADHADPAKLLPIAATALHCLADSWRRLLSDHRADPDGRCEACHRGRRWPCQVWQAAHEQLIGDDVPPRRRTNPLRSPFARFGAR
ncbi:hypothetical protein [Actinophytocola oryzae]|uniref:Uncharacterized protein n=1 Tax=Actinophytocola oryzae TaxID=502181 RepID=A0A4R7VRQ3_9PSEU|nr:hypothetical protein [Actinophytocola oryzae]TDV52424.1 hypothetical protein CLV71_105556 [Actinophytocola oryzae]